MIQAPLTKRVISWHNLSVMSDKHRETIARRHIHVDGVVQGVGFRPFVYGLATTLGLSGWVRNTSAGVDIEVQGVPAALDTFARKLRRHAPPLAVIESIRARDIALANGQAFEILHSAATAGLSLVAPDVATCADCRRELSDPQDRRYRYPFINCTNCGPRFTIIRALPYDRPQTTMQPFPMCPHCQAEYDDPTNRRFHAQPNACPVCGPTVRLWVRRAVPLQVGRAVPVGEQSVGAQHVVPVHGDAALRETAGRLRRGEITAVKGLGGFHLACDATNADAVQTMRARKGRPAKPFAVMVPDLDTARQHCHVSRAEAELLASPAAPIVLLRRRPGSTIAESVAPGNHYLGIMLPYTPLHHILLRDVARPLVMTSGNHTDEPLSYQNAHVIDELGDIADAFLLHNRDIHMRCDDSVTMVVEDALYPVRRSRGYAPYPITLSPSPPIPLPDAGAHHAVPPPGSREILAVGGQMKNTLCFLKGKRAFLSQHIGELDNLETLTYFEQAAVHLRDIFRARPTVLAHDAHPDYLSTRWAKGALSVATSVDALLPADAQRVAVQHHHAHIVACLADNDYPPGAGPVIGLAWDGTGYGPDGTIWGGECLLADYTKYARFAHLEYAPLPGGDAAIKRPGRLAVAYLHHFLGEVPPLPGLAHIGRTEQGLVTQQVARGYNTAMTSSMGRLFDVVAAMVGACPAEITFEAQAAIALEMLATGVEDHSKPYPFPLREGETGAPLAIQPGPALETIAVDVLAGVPASQIAARFHAGLAEAAVAIATEARAQHDLNTVALSGGVWQNRLLLGLTPERLRAAGFDVLMHRRVPPNDGGLSLGQAVVARANIDTES